MGFPKTRLKPVVPAHCGFCENRSQVETFEIKQVKIG